MLVLGLVLLLLAAATTVAAVTAGADDEALFTATGIDATTTSATVFVVGAVTAVVALVGLDLLRRGAGRARRHRQEQRKIEELSAKLDAAERRRDEDDATEGS